MNAATSPAPKDDEVAEWLRFHHQVNFVACSEAQRDAWRRRYVESHSDADGIE